MKNRWGSYEDTSQELTELEELQAHQDKVCNETTCIYCIEARDIDDMAEHVNKELDKGK